MNIYDKLFILMMLFVFNCCFEIKIVRESVLQVFMFQVRHFVALTRQCKKKPAWLCDYIAWIICHSSVLTVSPR